MKKVRNKKKDAITILISIACVCVLLGIATIALMKFVFVPKISYADVVKEYNDMGEETYIEKAENFNLLSTYEEINFSETLQTFHNTSKAVCNNIEYLSPYFLHIKLNAKNVKSVKKLNSNIARSKADFNSAISQINSLINEFVATGKDQNKKDNVVGFYYQSFLPKYLDYINSLNNLSSFMQNIVWKENCVTTSAKNLITLQDSLIAYSTNYVLPSIFYTQNEDADFRRLVNDIEIISIASLNVEFELLKSQNKFQLNTLKNANFKNQINQITNTIKTANEIFNSLSATQRRSYLSSKKIAPEKLPSQTSISFKFELLKSILAENNGTFFNLVNNNKIVEYFNV